MRMRERGEFKNVMGRCLKKFFKRFVELNSKLNEEIVKKSGGEGRENEGREIQTKLSTVMRINFD